jgi:hypothetical protein
MSTLWRYNFRDYHIVDTISFDRLL